MTDYNTINFQRTLTMDFNPSDNLSKQITQHLTERIISGDLKPGERILEVPLASQLGVSRAPVREALHILQKNRLVELIPRHGARVSPLSREYIEWLYEILVELYTIIVRQLIERPDNERFSRFEAALHRMETAARQGDGLAYYNARMDYAMIGLEGSDNMLLKETMYDFIPSVMRVQHLALTRRLGNIEQTLGYLKRFNGSMKNGDVDGGVSAIRALLECDKVFAIRAIGEEAG
ncbi:MAG: GntR family transcriptional regulator [Spirochaetes bacterium]|nr:GntR family transcriptional regulator [Spirochaetota bacterium]